MHTKEAGSIPFGDHGLGGGAQSMVGGATGAATGLMEGYQYFYKDGKRIGTRPRGGRWSSTTATGRSCISCSSRATHFPTRRDRGRQEQEGAFCLARTHAAYLTLPV